MKLGPIEITLDELKAFSNFLAEIFKRLLVPKVKKGTIGIVISLKTEEDESQKRLENDLVAELRQQLEQPSPRIKFSILQFPAGIAKKITNSEKAEMFLRRARGSFIVYGDLVKRQVKGDPNFVFRLNALVLHRHVSSAVQKEFAKQFTELLPRRLLFATSDELLGFEFTNQWVNYVSRYIIGMAALISGNLAVAHDLFESLENDLLNPKIPDDVPVLSLLKERVAQRMVDTYISELTLQYIRFTSTRDRSLILGIRPFLEKLSERNAETYFSRIMWGMLLFFEGKLQEAIDILRKSKEKDVAWRYSLGFLYAFKGDVKGALELYKWTNRQEVEGSFINDIDMFFSDIIDENSGKIQLLFFRGLVNHKNRNDYRLAKQDFEKFLADSNSKNFPELVNLANKYLSEIERHIGV